MYTIGEISTISGFSIDTLRYYEKVGLIPPPKRNQHGVRIYDQPEIETLAILKTLKSAGLSIEEMIEFLQARDFALTNKNTDSKYFSSVKKKVDILEKHLVKIKHQLLEMQNVIKLTEQQINHYSDILKKDNSK